MKFLLRILSVVYFVSCVFVFGQNDKGRTTLDNYKSTVCEPIFPSRNLNVTWVKNVEKWYLNAWDKSLYNYWLEYIEGPANFAKMNEVERSQTCMTLSSFENHTDTFAVSNGKYQLNLAPYFNPVRPGVIDWQLNATEYVGTSYILLTDNAEYFIALDMFPDGVKGLWAASVKKY